MLMVCAAGNGVGGGWTALHAVISLRSFQEHASRRSRCLCSGKDTPYLVEGTDIRQVCAVAAGVNNYCCRDMHGNERMQIDRVH